jgi:hypothetical protein
MADLTIREVRLFIVDVIEKFKRILEVAHQNTLIGVKTRLNFTDSPTINWSISDNYRTKSVDVSAAAVLTGTVPTTRTISTVSPITGGGDLTTNRTISFDQSVALDNNARVETSKNGTSVGVRREINFIEGTNVTLNVSDNAGSERVDVTINSSGGGSGLTHPQVVSRVLILG